MDGQHHISRTVSIHRGGRAVSWDATSIMAMEYSGGTSRSEHRARDRPGFPGPGCRRRRPRRRRRRRRPPRRPNKCVVASPSSWSPQPRFPRRRAASIHYLRSEHITGRGPARYPHESMAVVIVVRVRARHCICARHDCVNSDIHSYVRHPRSALSRFRDTRRWGWIRGTTWNVWRRCMVCDSPRMPSVGNSLSPSRAHDSSSGGLSALIYPR